MDYSLPGSSVHGISQERILKWVAISFSRGSSWPRDQTCVSCIAGKSFTTEPPGKPIPLSSVKYIPVVMKSISRTFSSYETIPIRQQLPICPSQAPGNHHSAFCLYEFSFPSLFLWIPIILVFGQLWIDRQEPKREYFICILLGASQVVLVVKNPPAHAGDAVRHSFNPWVGKVPWRREWQPTPVFLPGESHGQRSLEGYGPWGRKESTHASMYFQLAIQ